ncbi:MAG: DUF1569 domain-containing protein [Bacteroidetes bacterium]|nr:DUF1569 domain-containing protein [Bacteroidota bacterium]
MKNLFDDGPRQEIIERINKLTPESKQLWGKMSVSQMLAHNVIPMELALQNPKPARQFMGKIFGGMVKKKLLSPEPFKKNGFTPKEFRIDSPKEFNEQKEKLLSTVNRFKRGAIKDTVHPFFGNMTEDQWGQLQYKHLDHHLQQFGV